MSQDHIRYDILAQDALRSVIRKVLAETAATGQLPGEHHFFITFLTRAPGVKISPALLERYPDQMTIVVQYKFWDLEVSETQFEIKLSFSDQPEKLVIPFDSIRGFYDPSVNFELEFDALEIDEEEASEADVTSLSTVAKIEDSSDDNATGETGSESDDVEGGEAAASDEDGEQSGSADVVSLDAFRKKT